MGELDLHRGRLWREKTQCHLRNIYTTNEQRLLRASRIRVNNTNPVISTEGGMVGD